MSFKYQKGWYKRGTRYRFVLGGNAFFILYQTKSNWKTNEVTGLNKECDDWFPKAEYIGLELPGETKKSS